MPPEITPLAPPSLLHRLSCGECGWYMSILAATSEPLRQCPWCGWEDLDISTLTRAGAGQHISCATHGLITVEVLDSNIATRDFAPDSLFCPFCRTHPNS